MAVLPSLPKGVVHEIWPSEFPRTRPHSPGMILYRLGDLGSALTLLQGI